MTPFIRSPFTDQQQLEIGGDALHSFELAIVPMEADVYQVLAQWMVEVLYRAEASLLGELSRHADGALAELAQNALSDRGERCVFWTSQSRSEWLSLSRRLNR